MLNRRQFVGACAGAVALSGFSPSFAQEQNDNCEWLFDTIETDKEKVIVPAISFISDVIPDCEFGYYRLNTSKKYRSDHTYELILYTGISEIDYYAMIKKLFYKVQEDKKPPFLFQTKEPSRWFGKSTTLEINGDKYRCYVCPGICTKYVCGSQTAAVIQNYDKLSVRFDKLTNV